MTHHHDGYSLGFIKWKIPYISSDIVLSTNSTAAIQNLKLIQIPNYAVNGISGDLECPAI